MGVGVGASAVYTELQPFVMRTVVMEVLPMRSALIRTFGLLMTAACSSAPAAPVPVFGSPESAAAYLVLRARGRKETRTVILNIPPAVDMAAATLRVELRDVADSILVWRSDGLYGDPERRAELAHVDEYLILDMRRVGPASPDSTVMQVQEERCLDGRATRRIGCSCETSRRALSPAR
jgi:hypothetical protein